MSEVTIEVVEDADHPEGGHAVIRLNGLWLLPTNATFRIEPVDGASPATLTPDWPRGDRAPVATRLTPQGVEIVIGPDIVDAPPLLPGTPVAVSVPAAFVRAEVLWPDLPVSAPVTAPTVVLTAAELAAELESVALANRQREEAEALQKLRDQMNGSGGAHSTRDSGDGELRALSGLRLRPNGEAPATPVADPAPFVPASPSNAARNAAIAALMTSSTSGAGIPAVPSQSTALSLGRPPGRDLVPAAPKLPLRPQRKPLAMGLPFAFGFVVAALLTALFAWRQGSVSGPRGLDTAAAAPSLADVLAVTVVSPRGRSAAEVDLPSALKLADESLHATVGGADHAEASFWLRKSLALSVGTQQLSWTLTQLGTLYAQPAAGAPDYGKARLLWEMAAGSGDPVALCFLGALHEHGLGVPKNARQALGLYQRAKAQSVSVPSGATAPNGCADVDDAIARVRN